MTDRTMPSIPSFIERLGEVLQVNTKGVADAVRDAGSGIMAGGMVKGMTNVQNLGPEFVRLELGTNAQSGVTQGQSASQGQGQSAARR